MTWRLVRLLTLLGTPSWRARLTSVLQLRSASERAASWRSVPFSIPGFSEGTKAGRPLLPARIEGDSGSRISEYPCSLV